MIIERLKKRARDVHQHIDINIPTDFYIGKKSVKKTFSLGKLTLLNSKRSFLGENAGSILTNLYSLRSDPDLDTLPYQVNTLDRRVTMKSQRPKSLDLSSWSVESRGKLPA